MPDILFLANI